MEALQILNTLCTFPLEKMNTFLLTCLYLSFTLYTHFPYIPDPYPSATTSPYNANRRRPPPPQISFYNINCILFLSPQLNSQLLQSDSTICVAQITWFCERLRLQYKLHTLWGNKTSQCGSALSRTNITDKHKQHLILQLCYMQQVMRSALKTYLVHKTDSKS